MAHPEGNEFWRLRATHGLQRIFSTPQELWLAAEEYFKATDARCWERQEWVGKDGREVKRKIAAPYTLTALCIFFGVSLGYWRERRTQYKEKNEIDFLAVVDHIEAIIYNQKFEGATVGTYNAQIISRDLGLMDKTQLSTPPDEAFKITLDLNK